MAESARGKEIVSLHDSGFKLAETQREMTPLQKYVYVKAREHHYDDDAPDPTTMNKLQRVRH